MKISINMSQPGKLVSVVKLRALWVGIIALPIQVCYFSIFYLGFKTGTPTNSVNLLFLILALWCYLSYIVLLNDLADRKADAAVGKATIERGHTLSPAFLGILLALLVGTSTGVILLELHGDIVFDLLWLIAYVMGTLYSIPPVSLKNRGLAGFLTDSVIEKPLPILIIFAYFNYYGFEIILFPLIGELLDSVFKHQAHDYDIDVKEGLRTFAVELGKRVSDLLVKYLFDPLDALVVMLAFAVVISQIPGIRSITSLVFLLIVLGLAAVFFKSRKSIFRKGALSWIDPRLEDHTTYTLFLNAGFQLLLLPILGVGLATRNLNYLPLLVLLLIAILPHWLFMTKVGLVGIWKAFSLSK